MKSIEASQKEAIFTSDAPLPIGPYSQAVKVQRTVYLSGQIPKSPETDQMVTGNFKEEALQVFSNLSEVAKSAGGSLDDIVKLTIFLTDFSNFESLNLLMADLFTKPYPARSTIQVSALPAGARIEIEAIMVL